MGGFLGVSLLLALAGGEVSSGVRPQGAHQGHRDGIVRRRLLGKVAKPHCGAGKELVVPTHKARVLHMQWYEMPCSPNCDTFAGAGWPLGCQKVDFADKHKAKRALVKCMEVCSDSAVCDACLTRAHSDVATGWICAVERGKLVFGRRSANRFEFDRMWIKDTALKRYLCRTPPGVPAFGRRQGVQTPLTDEDDATAKADAGAEANLASNRGALCIVVVQNPDPAVRVLLMRAAVLFNPPPSRARSCR